MDVAKVKKQTNAYKTHFTISLNKLKDELKKEEQDISSEVLQQYLQQVELKFEKWETAMIQIQDNDADCDIEKSMDEINTVLDDLIETKIKAKEAIKKKSSKSSVKVEEDVFFEAQSSNPTQKVKDRMNLPKLTMKTFSGANIEEFQEWYQMFTETIHKSSLSTVEKFIYLKMSLEKDSEAEKLIEGYPVTAGNYDAALQELHDAYGDTEVLINHHISKLLNLPKQHGPQSLKILYNSIATHIRSLEALGISSDMYSRFLVPIVKSKLSDDLLREVTKKKIREIGKLLQELKEEVEIESSSSQVKLAFETEVKTKDTYKEAPKPVNKPVNRPYQPYQQPTSSAQSLTTNTRMKYCIFCPGKQSHWVEECNRLKNIPPNEVREIAMKSNACLRCLRRGHRSYDCRSSISCFKCGKNHNTALHEDGRSGSYVSITSPEEYTDNYHSEDVSKERESPEDSSNIKPEDTTSSSDVPGVKGAIGLHVRLDGKNETIMPIIKVRIKGTNGKKLEINALLDQCSDQSFIRSDVTKHLQLDGPKIPVEVAGITGTTDGKKERKMITTSIFNRDFTHEVNLNLVEMPVICKPIQRPSVDPNTLNNRNLRNLHLADNYLEEESKEIHMLLGLDHYYDCVTGRIKRDRNQPVAIETVFGWMLVSDSQNQELENTQHITTMFTSTDMERSLHEDIKKFWEIENAIITKPVKPENKAAVRKFHESVKYDPETKKYEVSLPFNSDKNIASNYRIAEKVLQSQMKRFETNPILKTQYFDAMNEYIDAGFAELVPEEEKNSTVPGIYYIPHSAVIKDENTTTKTRIVFNASSSGRNQESLNDKLLTGPNLQPSITEILIRWRSFLISLVADIRKMYSMILVRKEDRNSLRFLWVDENNHIQHYRHKVLAFGLSSAPYLAIETVQSHIKKFEEKYPEVTESLLDSTYVDDYCHGEDTIDEAIATVDTAHTIMTEAGMELRKWESNEPEVMKHCMNISPTNTSNEERKVLGVYWNSLKDTLFYKVNPTIYQPQTYISKRMIIGSAPKMHDPIGFISPIVVKVKMMIQVLWAAGVEWDENLIGTQVAEEWLRWREDLQNLQNLEINRKYVPVGANVINRQVHIFNDASEKAYATVAYLRNEHADGSVTISFITSKTKVAPLKVITLPRLELMSAVIGARLSIKIKNALKDPDMKVVFWLDSQIALHWIKNTQVRWKTFVENHTEEARECSDPVNWRYCPGKENPADIATRGTTVTKLMESASWWGAPSWLQKSEDHWPKRMNSLVPNSEALKEKRFKQYTSLVTQAVVTEPVISPHRYSQFSKLLRMTAYVIRFIYNLRQNKLKKPLRCAEVPTAEEIKEAKLYWLLLVQAEYYSEELARLKTKEPIKLTSKILQLTPYLEEESGLLRMKGRIENSQLTEDEKHPIILPHQSHIVRLIVEDTHQTELCAGVEQTLIALRNEYWVTHARSLVKNVKKSCLQCLINMPNRITVPMAQLPEDRVNEAFPFEIIGIDFTGPVIIEESKLVTKKTTKKCPVQVVKVKTTSKAYIALTTCAVTRAIHLELVPDLTTDAFLRSFRRFVSRRGTTSIIYSDNATTYKCAEKGIKECYEILNSPKFQAFLSEKSIKWKYICPASPWWGGYWERLMTTMKIPLKKILGKAFMTSDELYTILTEVEAMVNSRPLCSIHDDPEDMSYLTPANFLIGRSIINLPVRPLKHTEVNPTATRRELNAMLQKQERTLQKVWKFWTENYLRSLGVGPAIKENLTIKEGDLVMVASNHKVRCTWKVVRVSELIAGRDGKIRSVMVKVDGKIRRRPVQLLSQLEVGDSPTPATL